MENCIWWNIEISGNSHQAIQKKILSFNKILQKILVKEYWHHLRSCNTSSTDITYLLNRLFVICFWPSFLIHFSRMHPFSTPENIRKPWSFLIFLGARDKKGALRTNGLIIWQFHCMKQTFQGIWTTFCSLYLDNRRLTLATPLSSIKKSDFAKILFDFAINPNVGNGYT